MLPANRILILALAFVAASACMYLALEFASLALPVLMRMSASPASGIFLVTIFLIIVAAANQKRRRFSGRFIASSWVCRYASPSGSSFSITARVSGFPLVVKHFELQHDDDQQQYVGYCTTCRTLTNAV